MTSFKERKGLLTIEAEIIVASESQAIYDLGAYLGEYLLS